MGLTHHLNSPAAPEGLMVLGKVRLDVGRTTFHKKTRVEGWRKCWDPPPAQKTAGSYSELKDGARNKYIKGQERRIYCLLKVQSI